MQNLYQNAKNKRLKRDLSLPDGMSPEPHLQCNRPWCR